MGKGMLTVELRMEYRDGSGSTLKVRVFSITSSCFLDKPSSQERSTCLSSIRFVSHIIVASRSGPS